ncbi:MAG: carboxypeptidase regulatory-like domain-containing protein [Propionibacteriaceae bacterium]|nr:carboxypeptidase regulatory-like domain-containing protein [Propionibacteriaceae bacterium]
MTVRRTRLASLLAAALAVSLLWVGAPPAAMAEEELGEATISGVVTTTDGQPIAGASVYAYQLTAQGWVGSGHAKTVEDGSFTLVKMPSGSFTLEFVKSGYVREFWDDKPAYLPKEGFDVGAGEQVTGMDAVLFRSAKISGTVMAEDGNSELVAVVSAARFDERDGLWHELARTPAGQTRSGSYGRYVVNGLPPGTYTLCFTPFVPGAAEEPYLFGCWGTEEPGKSVEFVVGEGEALTKDVVILRGIRSFRSAPIPTISGRAAVGTTLVANPGVWDPALDQWSYEWRRDDVGLGWTAQSTYELTADDVGSRISVSVRGSHYGYTTTTRISLPTTSVAALAETPNAPKVEAKPLTAPKPTISGKAKVGKKLKAKPGSWQPSPVTLKYQWYRSGKKINKATKATYILKSKDRGKKITVKITGSKPGHITVTRVSKATSKVTR